MNLRLQDRFLIYCKLIASSADVALLEHEHTLVLRDENPNSDIELPLVDQQGRLHVFLNNEARTFDCLRLLDTRLFLHADCARSCQGTAGQDLGLRSFLQLIVHLLA
jgi:hypothetical protein